MPNRTEILHFRATPEEKGRIKENAGHAELHLSEWMRQRSLDRLVPTQPAVEGVPLAVSWENGKHYDEKTAHVETYEQFMERRVPELCGENPSVAELHHARDAAEVEWAER